jgi:LDH2 family malate/lactate/ureidoglycolate dehydrogenase
VDELVRVAAAPLRQWVSALFAALGMPEEDAAVSADALVTSDLLGVSSHGVSNYIELIYAPGLRRGTINARPNVRVLRENASLALVDGDGGMGHVVGAKAMRIAVDKARSTGIGVVTVRGSRHYGMAGYYPLLALEHGLIGASLTNADALVLPTFGREARLGTNPIAVAVPAGEEPPFLLDMATSTVPLGKIMLAMRAGAAIPLGWAADRDGRATTDARAAFEALRLLPLGGSYEQGSHKGYGLAALVDILCGALSGSIQGDHGGVGNEVGHFFAALDPDVFVPRPEFAAAMDRFLRRLRETPSVDPAEPVIYAGWKEHVARRERERAGIPLHPKVLDYLRRFSGELGVAAPSLGVDGRATEA